MLKRPERRNPTLPGTAEMGAYFEAAGTGAAYMPVDLSSGQLRACGRLSMFERATLRIEVPAPTLCPTQFGLLVEAQTRLGVLSVRGVLGRMSGQEVAAHLQLILFTGAGRPSPHANKGFQVLAELDARDMIRAELSTPMSSNARDGY